MVFLDFRRRDSGNEFAVNVHFPMAFDLAPLGFADGWRGKVNNIVGDLAAALAFLLGVLFLILRRFAFVM